MSFVIRPAETGDVPSIARMIEEIEKYYGSSEIQPFDTRLPEVEQALFGVPPASFALVAEDVGGDVVALAAYSFLWPGAGSNHNLYLKELYVREDARRRGIASQLMRELHTIAAARPGCSRVEWTTEHKNSAARSFYRVLGIPEHEGKIRYWFDPAEPWPNAVNFDHLR